jgi:hypothetical protein
VNLAAWVIDDDAVHEMLVRDKQDENSPAIRMRKCRRMRDERRA